MLIDASLGTACCGGSMAPRPPQPERRQPDALSVQMNIAQTAIANGAVLPLAGSVRQFGNGLAYDAANHAVIVKEAGVYFFSWDVLTQTAGEEGDVVIALQSLDGAVLLATSGAADVTAEGSTQVSGSAVAMLPAGSAWALVNASGDALSIPVAGTAPAAFAASLNVFRLSQ